MYRDRYKLADSILQHLELSKSGAFFPPTLRLGAGRTSNRQIVTFLKITAVIHSYA
jgi:hypothetical protein